MAEIQLLDPYNLVLKRNGTLVTVTNFDKRVPKEGFDIFESTLAGPRLKSFENTIFEGDNQIGDIIQSYPEIRLLDFEERPESSITLSGSKFNFVNSCKIVGVTLSSSNQILSSDSEQTSLINVANTEKFLESGYLLTEQMSIIYYQSKTSNSFIGYVVRGTTSLNENDEIVQYSYL